MTVKKTASVLLASIRAYVADGGTWDAFVKMVAPEFGAVFRDGAIDGWRKPETKKERR